MKTCHTCGMAKPLTAFYVARRKDSQGPAAQGRTGNCIECQKEINFAGYALAKKAGLRGPTKNWAKNYPAAAREALLRVKYGINSEIFDAMMDAQGGVCYICGRPPKARRLAIDHDHKLGKGNPQAVRGLLCFRCNQGLEKYADSPERLSKAVSYLLRPPAHKVIPRDFSLPER